MTLDKLSQLSTFEPQGIYVTYKNKTLVGGIKNDVKFLQKEMRSRNWRTLKRQGATLKKYRLSFLKFQKSVRAYALEICEERMWSYFILSSLRWFTPLKRGGVTPNCYLCDMNALNDLTHFLSCPALSLNMISVMKIFYLSYPNTTFTSHRLFWRVTCGLISYPIIKFNQMIVRLAIMV
jgi:hypothetical protein